MKASPKRLIIAAAAALGFVLVMLARREKPPTLASVTDDIKAWVTPKPDWQIAFEKAVAADPSALHRRAEQGFRGMYKPKSEMSDQERAALEAKFRVVLKPAMVKWCVAYAGRTPFAPDDVTLDDFRSLLMGDQYSFKVNNGTVALIFDTWENQAMVSYVCTEGTLPSLNKPGGGETPDMSMAVNREQIIDMVRRDTGTTYTPDKVALTPTAAGTAMQGGTSVDVNTRLTPRGDLILDESNISLTFNKQGKLVYYCRMR